MSCRRARSREPRAALAHAARCAPRVHAKRHPSTNPAWIRLAEIPRENRPLRFPPPMPLRPLARPHRAAGDDARARTSVAFQDERKSWRPSPRRRRPRVAPRPDAAPWSRLARCAAPSRAAPSTMPFLVACDPRAMPCGSPPRRLSPAACPLHHPWSRSASPPRRRAGRRRGVRLGSCGPACGRRRCAHPLTEGAPHAPHCRERSRTPSPPAPRGSVRAGPAGRDASSSCARRPAHPTARSTQVGNPVTRPNSAHPPSRRAARRVGPGIARARQRRRAPRPRIRTHPACTLAAAQRALEYINGQVVARRREARDREGTTRRREWKALTRAEAGARSEPPVPRPGSGARRRRDRAAARAESGAGAAAGGPSAAARDAAPSAPCARA